MKKNIAIFSAGRSDFGILKPLIVQLLKNKKVSLSVLFGFAHQEKIFGNTLNESTDLNFNKINIKLKGKIRGHSIHDTINSFSTTLKETSKFFKNHNTDNFVIAGDRYETLAAVIAAKNYNIKISHLCGGSITLGSLDDYYRNCISNIADLHFVETAHHKTNLKKRGIIENVIVVGAPALENLLQKKITYSQKIKTEKKIVVTYHPDTTLSLNKNIKDLKTLLSFLLKIKDYKIIFTYPNADTGFKYYIKLIKSFNLKSKNTTLIKNLGIKKYYETLNSADLMIGNSSSGIIESASFNIPVINLGNRQKKRFAPKNVIHCNFDINELNKKLKIAKSTNFKRSISKIKNPYFKKDTSKKIINKILSH